VDRVGKEEVIREGERKDKVEWGRSSRWWVFTGQLIAGQTGRETGCASPIKRPGAPGEPDTPDIVSI
jgi:hypothetical protein